MNELTECTYYIYISQRETKKMNVVGASILSILTFNQHKADFYFILLLYSFTKYELIRRK